MQRTGEYFLRYHLIWQRFCPLSTCIATRRTGNGVQPLWSTEKNKAVFLFGIHSKATLSIPLSAGFSASAGSLGVRWSFYFLLIDLGYAVFDTTLIYHDSAALSTFFRHNFTLHKKHLSANTNCVFFWRCFLCSKTESSRFFFIPDFSFACLYGALSFCIGWFQPPFPFGWDFSSRFCFVRSP